METEDRIQVLFRDMDKFLRITSETENQIIGQEFHCIKEEIFSLITKVSAERKLVFSSTFDLMHCDSDYGYLFDKEDGEHTLMGEEKSRALARLKNKTAQVKAILLESATRF